MSAVLIFSSLTLAGLTYYGWSITVVPAFTDSDEFDMEISIPLANGKTQVDRATGHIVIQNDIPQATVYVTGPNTPDAVPKIEAIERGGAKEVRRSWK